MGQGVPYGTVGHICYWGHLPNYIRGVYNSIHNGAPDHFFVLVVQTELTLQVGGPGRVGGLAGGGNVKNLYIYIFILILHCHGIT